MFIFLINTSKMPVRPTMNGYDEGVTVIRGKRTTEQSKRDDNTTAETKHKHKEHSSAMRKLDEETENVKHKKVTMELRLKIQKARQDHG